MKTFLIKLLPIALLVAIIIGVMLNHFHKKIEVLEEQLSYYKDNPKQVHDTIYIDKPFPVEVPYKVVEVPKTVKYYLDNPDIQKPKNDSLYSFKFNNKSLQISLFKDSSYLQEIYDLNLDKYQYLYTDGVLTVKKNKLWRLKPYTELRVRPINLMFDLSAGMILKTKLFNYKLGANIYYYPKYNKGIGKDVEITISYNF